MLSYLGYTQLVAFDDRFFYTTVKFFVTLVRVSRINR